MATFNTVWSLDVGRSSLKAVKLRKERNNIEILAVDKIDYKPSENGVDVASKAKEAINAFRVRNDVTEPVIVAHNGQGTLSRFIKVPAFEPKKVKEMVGYEASQQIPFPLDEVVWDYHVVDKEYLPGEECEVGLFAARRETIDDYLLDFTGEDLAVEGLTIGYLGLLNYIFYDINPQEPAIVLDIGGSHTDLILVDGKKFWIRTLPHSGNDISKAIMERLKLGFPEAEKLKNDIGKNPQQAAKLFTAVVQPKLRELVNQIHQSVGFYRSQVGEANFTELYLLGNGSRIVGIKKFLEEHLRMKVFRVSTINHLRINRDVDVQLLQGNLPAFGTAFGAALQGVGAGSCRVDLIPQEEKLEKEYQRKKIHVFLAIAILYVVTALSGFMVKQKVDGAAEVATNLNQSGSGYLAQVKSLDGKIRRVEDATVEDEARSLESVATLRNRPIAGLRLLSEVLSGLPVSKLEIMPLTLDAETKKPSPERMRQFQEKALQLAGEKLWIPWMEVRKIEYPEPEGSRTSSRRKSNQPTVPAYKFSIFAVVKQQGDPQTSLELINKRLRDPLAAKLETSGLSLDPKVNVDPDFVSNLPRIERPGGGGRDRDTTTYEDGPFFGAELNFIMRAEDPPAPEESEEKPRGR